MTVGLRRGLDPQVEAGHEGTTVLVPDLVFPETSDLLDTQLIQPFAYLADIQRIVVCQRQVVLALALGFATAPLSLLGASLSFLGICFSLLGSPLGFFSASFGLLSSALGLLGTLLSFLSSPFSLLGTTLSLLSSPLRLLNLALSFFGSPLGLLNSPLSSRRAPLVEGGYRVKEIHIGIRRRLRELPCSLLRTPLLIS